MSRKSRKFLSRAAAIVGTIAVIASVGGQQTNAQMGPPIWVPMGAPMAGPPPFLPPQLPPRFVPPAFAGMPGGLPGGFINPDGRDAWGVAAPAIGAGVTAGMSAYPLTRPIAPWAGERVTANAGSAYRESGVGNQMIRAVLLAPPGKAPASAHTEGSLFL